MITTAERSEDGIFLRCALDSCPASVTATLRDIRSVVHREAPALKDGHDWELVVAEVLNNIVEHAYGENLKGRICVDLHFHPNGLRADFTDFGRAMPGLVAPDGAAADLDVAADALPEGGFGWFLIRSLSRDLQYRREHGSNHLSLTVPLDPGS